MPGTLPVRIESAARQVYFTRRNVEGMPQQETERIWSELTSATACVALALHDDPKADVSGWRSWRPYRATALSVATKGVHQGATITKNEVSDLRKTVEDILEGN